MLHRGVLDANKLARKKAGEALNLFNIWATVDAGNFKINGVIILFFINRLNI